jgi:hypothetical protein
MYVLRILLLIPTRKLGGDNRSKQLLHTFWNLLHPLWWESVVDGSLFSSELVAGEQIARVCPCFRLTGRLLSLAQPAFATRVETQKPSPLSVSLPL